MSSKELSFTDYLSIRNILNQYAIALDSKDFSLLDSIFTLDATCDFQAAGMGIFDGVHGLKEILGNFLAPVDSQHAITTQYVEASKEGEATARTYVTAQHFGRGKLTDETWFVWAYYDDELVKNGAGQWRIRKRTMGFHHAPIGNPAILHASSSVSQTS